MILNFLILKEEWRMKDKGFKYKKGFGQNFLTDPKICKKIVDKAKIDGGLVLEIGPGSGILTNELLNVAEKVIAVEKDRDLIPILKEKFKDIKNFELINEDFLRLDLKKIVEENKNFKEFRICANLPYYITSPAVVKILSSKLEIKTTTLMLQKEVAKRFVAKKGDSNYGSISVFVQYFSEPEILFNVLRGSFFPAPNVDSAVINLKKKTLNKTVADEEFFFEVVRTCFSQKRKKILNPLYEKFKAIEEISKKELEEILKELEMENKRAQELSIDEYIFLSNRLYKRFKNII